MTYNDNVRHTKIWNASVRALLESSCWCEEEVDELCARGNGHRALGVCGELLHGSCSMPVNHRGPHNHWHVYPGGKQPKVQP